MTTRNSIALTLVALVIVACGGDDDDDVITPTGAKTPPATTASATWEATEIEGRPTATSRGSLLHMLGAVPDTKDASYFLLYSDLTQVRALLGVDRPPGEATSEEVDEYWSELSVSVQSFDAVYGMSQWALDLASDAEGTRAELGFDVGDVDQVLQTGLPPAMYNVAAGRLNSAEIPAAVATDPKWSDALEHQTEGDTDFYSWLDDYQMDFERLPTARDRLGRGGRLALVDDLLLWTLGTDEMIEMIQAASNDVDSLADREDFAAMARKLDEIRAITVTMSDRPQSVADYGMYTDFPDTEPLMTPFLSWTIASAHDANGTFMVVIIANENEEVAAENAQYLTERIENGTSREHGRWSGVIPEYNIVSEGTLTVGILRGESLPFNLVAQSDPLLLHE